MGVVALITWNGVFAAAAAPPVNDTEAGAIEIGSLPFTHSMDTTEAGADGPRFCTNRASVFYSFSTDTRMRVQVDLVGSEYDTTLGVYTRTDAGKVQPITCNDDRFGLAASVRFRADVGVTYFLIVGQCCGTGPVEDDGGPLVLRADRVSKVEVDGTLEFTGGTTDPDTGVATLFGTATCNELSVIQREGVLRQVREGLFLARGYFYVGAVCVPGAPAEWSVEVETDTGIIFGPGTAVLRSYYEFATDGYRDFVYTEDVPDVTVTLT
jgi:hypothetical protein